MSKVRLPKNNQGFALLVVIVIMMLVSFLAVQLVMQVRAELTIAHNVKSRARGRFLAEAGISLACFRLLENMAHTIVGGDGEEMDKFLTGYVYETVFSYGKIEYYAVDESGKININTNNREYLKLFLSYQGLDDDQAEIVIDSLFDWRDTNDAHRLNGAEKDYYQGLGEPYSPKDGPITEPSEFFLIKGTESLRGKFDPNEVFTVYSKKDVINFNSLTPDMLDFVVAGNEEQKTLYYETLKENERLSVADLQEIIGETRYAELQRYLQPAGNTNIFFLQAQGYVGTGADQEASPQDGQDTGDNENAEDGTPKKDRPGSKIQVLARKQNDGFQYLFWKEKLI